MTRGTVDVLLSEVSYFAILAEAQGFTGYSVHNPPLATDDVFLLLHERHRDKMGNLAEALSRMVKDGSIAKLCPPCDQTMNLSATAEN